jgi:hypothetical protein
LSLLPQGGVDDVRHPGCPAPFPGTLFFRTIGHLKPPEEVFFFTASRGLLISGGSRSPFFPYLNFTEISTGPFGSRSM